MSWISALLGLAVGALAGYLIARRFGGSGARATALQQELDRAREEHAAYRSEVGEHFARTAVAVNQLTESYRTVHQQLSEGARTLCDDEAAQTALAFDRSRLIDPPGDDAAGDGEARDASPAETDTAVETDAAQHDEVPGADEEADRPADAAGDPAPVGNAPRGGASWTPPDPPTDLEPPSDEALDAPRAPRDYADDDAGDRATRS